MKREIFNKLLSWKANPNRKPLILDGARQVGKTWILNQFGKTKYNNVAYINCDKVAIMKTVFSDFDTKRLIRAFSAITNEVIKPAETLIILDEIQEAPLGLTALKYFYEDANEYHRFCCNHVLITTLLQYRFR